MIKKNTKLRLAILAIGTMSIMFTSCGEDEIFGCTDPIADNYDELADMTDGSCQYSGEIVFWYNQATAQALILDNATALTYYVDGEIVGSSAASVYWTGAPNCGQAASVTVKRDLGNAKNLSYSYSVIDDTGWEYWHGIANFTTNTCVDIQLSASKVRLQK
tara:strand:- start:157 stop:639 length:483 start_codon:yes stop_codon:yes gene_type:complete